MKKFILWIDPYKQSCLFFKWNFICIVLLLGLATWMTIHWKSPWIDDCLNNVFVYFPNYLTHEMLGHNLVGGILFRMFYSIAPQAASWLHTLAGNGVETLVPFVLYLCLLQIDGGRWGIPPVLYWLASSFYGAGEYAADARACSMPLTSSDMLTNYKPGEICGDWHHILEPINMLAYDQIIAHIFLFIGCVVFLLAIYSFWYYWTHTDQYTFKNPLPPRLQESDLYPLENPPDK